jgi:hypothetical protein
MSNEISRLSCFSRAECHSRRLYPGSDPGGGQGTCTPQNARAFAVQAAKPVYSPKHGSWLNMAESELAVLSNQCLDRRIPDQETLINEIAAWEKDGNKHPTKADWQFTPADARIKLKYLYPTF